jgi:hypothetical protein
LNASEAFLIDQTVNCLSLFALSRGEYALAADASRFVLKRQGSLADAGIWLMRGLAFAGMGKLTILFVVAGCLCLSRCFCVRAATEGAPYLAKLHFSSASSVNADYAGLKECLHVLDAAQVAHARRIFWAKKEVRGMLSYSVLRACLQRYSCQRWYFMQDQVDRELARAVRRYFAPRSHILKEVPDLAVLTVAEVRNFLSESYSVEQDPGVVFQLDECRPNPAVSAEAQQLHVDDGSTSTRAAAGYTTGEDASAVEVTAGVLQSTIERLVREHVQKGKSATASSPFAALSSSECGQGGAAKLCAAAALQILRGLFYEAQVREIELLTHWSGGIISVVTLRIRCCSWSPCGRARR